jgi:hypothetical protein
MDLVDRYLHAVRLWLPSRAKDDIVAELSEDIHSEIDERSAAKGRPLTEPELADLIARHGRPIVAASRYRPEQTLIGPALFPIYAIAIRMLAVIYVVPWVIAWLWFAVFFPFFGADNPARLFFQSWPTFWVLAFALFGLATAIFAIAERIPATTRLIAEWDPKRLPQVRVAERIPRVGSIMEIVIQLTVAFWWIGLPREGADLRSFGVTWSLGPVWEHLHTGMFMPVLMLALASAALASVNLVWPYWTRPRHAGRAAIHAAAVLVLGSVARAHWGEALSQSTLLSQDHALSDREIASIVANVAVYWAVAGCAIGSAVGFVVELIKLLRWTPFPTPRVPEPRSAGGNAK